MIAESRCQQRSCKQYRGVTSGPEVQTADGEPEQAHYCAAFPVGIPTEIAFGDDPHETPRPDDRGIQFEAGDPTPYAPTPGVDDDAPPAA